ncbi:MAG: hypothetical protein P8Y75_10530 [Nitrospirota bacterium]
MKPPGSFTFGIERLHRGAYRLTASQLLPLPREKAFTFFEDPANLFAITPGWLDFRMTDPRQAERGVFEGAEFDYTIRWAGLRIPWRSRIVDYHPPERFRDIQVRGPYAYWGHLHVLEESRTPSHKPGGGVQKTKRTGEVSDRAAARQTLMRDEVLYALPLGPLGRLLHIWKIEEQLRDIWRHRAARIDAWAREASGGDP